MNTQLLVLLLIVAVIALMGVMLLKSGSQGFDLIVSNFGEGTHAEGKLTRSADAAFGSRNLLCKAGAGANTVDVCTDGDKPIGIVTDEVATADIATEVIGVELLGLANRTLLMVASGVIAIDADVYTDDAGKIQALPVAAGTYYKVGIALNAAAADEDEVEVAHCHPVAVTVV